MREATSPQQDDEGDKRLATTCAAMQAGIV